jgi:hypothetical protein
MKAETFTFRINPETRAALDQIAASKEWTTGHLANSVLTEYVTSVGKPAKAKRVKAAKQQSKPAASESTAASF